MRSSIPFACCLLITGCMATSQQVDKTVIEPTYQVNEYQPSNRVYTINDYLLDDYAEQIAMRLMDNLAAEPHLVRIAVASFVDLDGSLQTASRLGNQIAESMLTEVQAFGLHVVDHKVMPKLLIDTSGDYGYSRNTQKLNTNGRIDAVLSGTLLYKENGVVVNSRITSLQDQSILASAKYLIPYSVAFDG